MSAQGTSRCTCGGTLPISEEAGEAFVEHLRVKHPEFWTARQPRHIHIDVSTPVLIALMTVATLAAVTIQAVAK